MQRKQIHPLYSPTYPEYILCVVLIFSRGALFFLQRGHAVGWDVDVHLTMLEDWPWSDRFWSVHSAFYAFHPPLAFAAARTILLLGLSPVSSVQFLNGTLSLIGFLSLRQTLICLGFLRQWRGIAFLYITSSLPLQIYLAHSINIDVFLLTATCAALFSSISLFWIPHFFGWRLFHALATIFTLTLALFTKSSGFLLLFLPLLTALLAPLPTIRTLFLRMCVGISLASVALLLASPYYYHRYVLPEHTLFVNNMDLKTFDKDILLQERATLRDRDRFAYLRDMFWGTTPGTEAIEERDQQKVRLLNSWKDIWSASKHNFFQSGASLSLSNLYAGWAFLLLPIGILLFALSRPFSSLWHRFGMVLLLFGFLQLSALIAYGYRYPHPIGLTTKIIYISPVILTIGYFLSFPLLSIASFFPLRLRHSCTSLFFASLVLFLLLNHLLPVY